MSSSGGSRCEDFRPNALHSRCCGSPFHHDTTAGRRRRRWATTTMLVTVALLPDAKAFPIVSRASTANRWRRLSVHRSTTDVWSDRTTTLTSSPSPSASTITTTSKTPSSGKVTYIPSSSAVVADNIDNESEDSVKAGTIPKLTTSLVKSIVGSGILALPHGIAALGDSPRVIPYAMALMAVVGGMNAYYFRLLGQVCDATGSTSYREAWDRTVGTQQRQQQGNIIDDAKVSQAEIVDDDDPAAVGSQVVAGVIAVKTALACLAYSIILADSFQSLGIAAGINGITRTEALLGVTGVVLLPLCLLEDLTALAPFSFLGLVGMAVAGGAICYRHIDGSYAPGGEFWDDLARIPAFGDTGPQWQGVVLACTLVTAFVAHYNAPRFHSELENNTPERFDAVVGYSYAIAAVTFMIVASQGFLTFGSSSASIILSSYSLHDPLIAASRAAVSASILFAFPLPFVGFRDGMLDLLKVPEDDRPDVLMPLSVLLLAGVTAAASVTHDLALVLSVSGGTLSTTIASVFPTIMYRAAASDPETRGQLQHPQTNTQVALALMMVSVTIGATGVVLALQRAAAS